MPIVKHAEFLPATEMNILAVCLLCWRIAAYRWEQLLSSRPVLLVSKDFGDLSWKAGVLKRSRAFFTEQNGFGCCCSVHSWQSLWMPCLKKKINQLLRSVSDHSTFKKISCWELFLAIQCSHPSLQPSTHTGKALVVTRQKLVVKLFNEFKKKGVVWG